MTPSLEPHLISAIVWDLDGTLFDSLGISTKIWQDVLPRHGFAMPTSESVAQNYHGTLRETAQALAGNASAEQIDSLVEAFHLHDNSRVQEADKHLFPDAVRLAQRAHKAGIQQIVVTNRAHGIGRGNASPRNFINNSKLKQLIDVVICGDEVDERKPNAKVLGESLKDSTNLLVIGDQFVDAQFAKNLGGSAVLVARNGGQIPHLERLGNDWHHFVTIVASLDGLEL